MLARQSHSKIHLLSQIKHLIWYIYVRHDGMTSSGRRPRWGEVRSPIRVGSILALEMLHFGAFSEFGPNFTGWRFLREASFLFVLAYFFTSAFMAARHHILLRLYIWRLTLNHAAVSDPDRHRHYSCRQRDEPLYRWPCLSGGRCTGLECIAFVCQNIVDVLGVSSLAENTAIQGILWRPDMTALSICCTALTANFDITFCTVPVQHFFCDSVTIILTFYNNNNNNNNKCTEQTI